MAGLFRPMTRRREFMVEFGGVPSRNLGQADAHSSTS